MPPFMMGVARALWKGVVSDLAQFGDVCDLAHPCCRFIQVPSSPIARDPRIERGEEVARCLRRTLRLSKLPCPCFEEGFVDLTGVLVPA